MNIFLDDVRNPRDVTWCRLPSLPTDEIWIVVRSYENFVRLIDLCSNRGQSITRICFDHDLAPEHYPGADNWDGGNTGKECAEYLAKTIISNEWPIPEYVIHSLNPAAQGRIGGVMHDIKRYREIIS